MYSGCLSYIGDVAMIMPDVALADSWSHDNRLVMLTSVASQLDAYITAYYATVYIYIYAWLCCIAIATAMMLGHFPL